METRSSVVVFAARCFQLGCCLVRIARVWVPTHQLIQTVDSRTLHHFEYGGSFVLANADVTVADLLVSANVQLRVEADQLQAVRKLDQD